MEWHGPKGNYIEGSYCEVVLRGIEPGLCRPFRKTGRGVYCCGELKIFKVVGEGKPTSSQFIQERGLKGPESQRYDPKPGDLGQGKVKSLN